MIEIIIGFILLFITYNIILEIYIALMNYFEECY